MASQSLHESIRQSPTGRVLQAINDTEAHIGRQQIDFPRIAVFGDESTGKSSMLEAICKIPFPHGKTTTTRCPTMLSMQRREGVPWSATAWVGYAGGQRDNKVTVHKPEEITEVISTLQSKLLENTSSFSADPICVEIEAEDTFDLTLIDLPGYFTHAGLDHDQNDGDVDKVKDALLKYLRDANTIVLVVVPANQLVKTANIFNLLKEHEKNLSPSQLEQLHQRTIYCFTKCDLVGRRGGQDAPHDIEEILSNKGPFAAHPHGWYAVVNNGGKSQQSSTFMERMARDREYEKTFFDRSRPYKLPPLRPRCGTSNLVQMLTSLLEEKIAQNVPKMLTQTNNALVKANGELKNLGATPLESENLQTACRTIIEDIKTYFVQATEGIYGRLKDEAEDLSEGLKSNELEPCKLGYIRKKRIHTFAKDIRRARLPLDDQSYLRELQTKVVEAADGKFELTMPIPGVLFEEVRICAKQWRNLAQGMCDDIADSAKECLRILVRVKAGKYANLPGKLNEHFEKMINEQKGKAQNRLAWHIVDERVRPDTLNVLFEQEVAAMKKLPGLGKNRQANRNAYVCNLKAYLPIAEARFIDNAVRTVTTHIFDVPASNMLTRVDSEEGPKFTFHATQIFGEDEKDLMKIRDDLSDRRQEVEKKVWELSNLRDALRAMPAAKWVVEESNGGGYQSSADSFHGKETEMHKESSILEDDDEFKRMEYELNGNHSEDSLSTETSNRSKA